MNCKECGKELVQVKGKRAKEYCDDACKKRFQRKNRDLSENGDIGEIKTHQDCAGSTQIGTAISGQGLNRDNIGTINEPILNWAQPDCQCRHCLNVHKTRPEARLNHGDYMTAAELELNGYDYNRVSILSTEIVSIPKAEMVISTGQAI